MDLFMKKTICVMLGVLCAAGVCAAKGFDGDTAPPRFTLEFRGSAYKPAYGTSQLERSYYDLVFESGKDTTLLKMHRPLIKGLEWDWYPWGGNWGIFGIGGKVGFWQTSGPTRVCKGTDGAQEACTPSTVYQSSAGNDKNQLTIIPLAVHLVYRADVFQRLWSVPLVPYVKAGVDYHFWWVKSGDKTASRGSGVANKARGGTAGYSATAGLSVSLLWLDMSSKQSARRTSGIVNSSLFVEYTALWGDGFGVSKRFDMSDRYVTCGLSLDML
jgi:hypothetical protein